MKAQILVACLVLASGFLFFGQFLEVRADSSGPLSPSTVVNDTSTGTIAWTNPTNATASDDAKATANFTSVTASNYLKATGFGFNIPNTSIVQGILVEIEDSYNFNQEAIYENSIKIVKNGTISGAEKALGLLLPDADNYDSYGGATDLWGLTWTPSDINTSTLGAAISIKCPSGCSIPGPGNGFVDHIRITVYYSAAVAAGKKPENIAPVIQNLKVTQSTSTRLVTFSYDVKNGEQTFIWVNLFLIVPGDRIYDLSFPEFKTNGISVSTATSVRPWFTTKSGWWDPTATTQFKDRFIPSAIFRLQIHDGSGGITTVDSSPIAINPRVPQQETPPPGLLKQTPEPLPSPLPSSLTTRLSNILSELSRLLAQLFELLQRLMVR